MIACAAPSCMIRIACSVWDAQAWLNLLSLPCCSCRHQAIAGTISFFDLRAFLLLFTLCTMLPTIMQDVGCIFRLVTQSCSSYVSCRVTAGQSTAIAFSRRGIGNCRKLMVELQMEVDPPLKTMCMPDLALLKKVVLVVSIEGGSSRRRIHNRSIACM